MYSFMEARNLNIQSGRQGQNATVLLRTWMLQLLGSRETSLLSLFAIEKEDNTEEVDTYNWQKKLAIEWEDACM